MITSVSVWIYQNTSSFIWILSGSMIIYILIISNKADILSSFDVIVGGVVRSDLY